MAKITEKLGSILAKAALRMSKKSAAEAVSVGLLNGRSLDQLDNLNGFFSGLGSAGPRWINLASRTDYIFAYRDCPPLTSIINNKAQADINGRITFVKASDDSPINMPYNGNAKKLKDLFDKPNPLQDWKQFRSQQKIYIQIFGFCPVLMIKPAGFKDPLSTYQMWNIPPELVTIETTGKLMYQSDANGIIAKIFITSGGVRTELPVSDVLFLKDQTVSFNIEILPESRFLALRMPISNIQAALESTNVITTKRGALGIFSNTQKDANGFVPITPGEVEAFQKDLARYGITKDTWQFIVTSAGLTYQPVTLSIKDLMLIETIQNSVEMVCDGMGYQFELLANKFGKTFNNVGEAKSYLYTSTIIPESESDFETYSNWFLKNQTGIKIKYDFSHVSEVKNADRNLGQGRYATAQAAQLMFKSEMITLNQARIMCEADTVEGDDIYYSEWKKANPSEIIPPINPDPNVS